MEGVQVEMNDIRSGKTTTKSDKKTTKSDKKTCSNQETTQNKPKDITTLQICDILHRIGLIILILICVYVIISLIASMFYLFYLTDLVDVPEPSSRKVNISSNTNNDITFNSGNNTCQINVVDNPTNSLYPMRQWYIILSDNNKGKVKFENGNSIKAYNKDGRYYTHYACELKKNRSEYICEDLTTSFIVYILDKVSTIFWISLCNICLILIVILGMIMIVVVGCVLIWIIAMCIYFLASYVINGKWPCECHQIDQNSV